MKLKVNLILSLFSALILIGCSEVEQRSKTPRKVKCTEVESYEIEAAQVELAGKVVAASESNLSFRVAGVIDRVVVKEGQRVTEGQVVALLDDRDYLLQLAATQAEYDAIKAEVDRVVALYDQNSVSANDYDKAVNGLKQITAKLSAHKNALQDTKLRAPYSGTIEKRLFDKGEAVAAGMPVVSLVATSQPEVIVNLPAREYLRLSNIISAEATIDQLSESTFPLTFIGSSPKANLNQLYPTRFLVGATNGTNPSAGMSTMVTINFEVAKSNLMSIPMSAVTQSNDSSMVWIYKDGRVKARPIVVNDIKRDGCAIVESGLSVGEVIVSAGINSLKEGQEVTPLEAKAESNVGGVL